MSTDPNCKHLDLIVQRNNGVRWVTCTICHADFVRSEELDDLRADNESLRGVLQYISVHDEHPTIALGEMHTEVVPYGWARGMVRIARAALDDKPKRCACCGLNYSRAALCRECNVVGETHDCPV